ncbi:S4 domain-containing protein YaaA [Streptococcus porcinus]|uniref:S4 domain protein YaaA n=2 Tax=Streptococcus porcinus TaxID=1340 RepID=A0ABN0CVQ9_STRPO|nr:S4 domain-containing protein YaaA [Streptococcus porcinus]EGJ27251.1 S4 domain protein YaaA [Streptococcus porcinus str. Jelinkova 176]SQG48809.1 hypothetical cytosolic protein [Streptococcus porcinus]VTT47216.1 hypothetical cytosolic protein [Streptococcus porcinus]VTT48239.1 hypothetical cytosolic protein [Streptococcus porcinus]
MDYKLFTEFITLQALLKEVGIIQSGGAIKSFLSETTVLFNGQDEKRRGKKLRVGDSIEIPSRQTIIRLIEPTSLEKEVFQKEAFEKERLAKRVKEINKANKKQLTSSKQKKPLKDKQKPIRFPGM